MSRHRTRWFAAGIAVLTAAALGFVALPAHAAGTGTVTGRFTDGATPVPDAFVALYDLDFNQVLDTTTDADGAFTLTDVPVGDYKLSFSIPGVVTQFAFGKPEDFDGADVITVSDGEVTTVEDTLAPHGEIAGRVTDASGAPAAFVQVTANTPDFSYFAFTQGDADGNYRFRFLPAGSYVVAFTPNDGGSTQYANNRRSSDEADHIVVVNGATTTLDQQFMATATIRGRFTRQGEPVADARVRAIDPTAGTTVSTSTDPDGAYRLTVWPGTYVLQFERSDQDLTQYARQKLTEQEADRFTVGPGEELVVDEEAIATGTITGRLTDPDGNPVAGAGVGVSNYGTDRTGFTDADGRYEVEVFPGAYRVSFHPRRQGRQWAHSHSSAGTADLFTVVGGESTVVDEVLRPTGSITVRATDAATGAGFDEFCVFIPDVLDFECTTDGVIQLPTLPGRYQVQASVDLPGYLTDHRTVTVTSGQDTAVTIPLPREARITTTVTDRATGAPVADVCVEPVRPLDPAGLGKRAFSYCSDESGRVTIDLLEAGTYNLFAWARDGEHGHQWVGWNGGVGVQVLGRLVTVKAGQTVAVPPVKLDAAGTITGVMASKATGEPIGGVVGLSTFDGGFGLTEAQVQVGPDGRYSFTRLGPYEWPLFFASFGLASQWSGGTPNRLLAAGVRVRAGRTTTYDQALRRGSTLSVRVTGPGGTQIDFARITAQNALTGDVIGIGDCERTQRCELPVLGPQGVRLRYHAQASGEQYGGYHRDAGDFLHATIVLVPSSGTRNVTVEATRPEP